MEGRSIETVNEMFVVHERKKNGFCLTYCFIIYFSIGKPRDGNPHSDQEPSYKAV